MPACDERDREGEVRGAGVALGEGHVVDRDVGWRRSSFWIVPRPWLSVILALCVEPVRLTKKVSSGSTVVSPMTGTVIVLVGSPSAKVSWPLVAV